MIGTVITQSGGGIQINNIGNAASPTASHGSPTRIVVTKINLSRANAQDPNSPMEWRVYLKNSGGAGYQPKVTFSYGINAQELSAEKIDGQMKKRLRWQRRKFWK